MILLNVVKSKSAGAITAIGADRREERRDYEPARRSGMVFTASYCEIRRDYQELSVTHVVPTFYCRVVPTGATKEARQHQSMVINIQKLYTQHFIYLAVGISTSDLFCRCYAKHPNLSECQRRSHKNH